MCCVKAHAQEVFYRTRGKQVKIRRAIYVYLRLKYLNNIAVAMSFCQKLFQISFHSYKATIQTQKGVSYIEKEVKFLSRRTVQSFSGDRVFSSEWHAIKNVCEKNYLSKLSDEIHRIYYKNLINAFKMYSDSADRWRYSIFIHITSIYRPLMWVFCTESNVSSCGNYVSIVTFS